MSNFHRFFSQKYLHLNCFRLRALYPFRFKYASPKVHPLKFHTIFTHFILMIAKGHNHRINLEIPILLNFSRYFFLIPFIFPQNNKKTYRTSKRFIFIHSKLDRKTKWNRKLKKNNEKNENQKPHELLNFYILGCFYFVVRSNENIFNNVIFLLANNNKKKN